MAFVGARQFLLQERAQVRDGPNSSALAQQLQGVALSSRCALAITGLGRVRRETSVDLRRSASSTEDALRLREAVHGGATACQQLVEPARLDLPTNSAVRRRAAEISPSLRHKGGGARNECAGLLLRLALFLRLALTVATHLGHVDVHAVVAGICRPATLQSEINET